MDAPAQKAIAEIPEAGWKHYAGCAVAGTVHSMNENQFVLFKHSVLAAGSLRHKAATVRWRLFHLPGKVVRHAGAWVLKVAAGAVDLFRSIRTKSFALAQAMSP